VLGTYSRVRGGYGFVEVEGKAAERFTRDVLIPEGMEDGALHGDRVEIQIVRSDQRTRRATGEITKVVERKTEQVVGVLENRHGGWWAVPESDRLPRVQVVESPGLAQSDMGKLVLVRITRSPTPHRAPAGTIEKVLGDADDPEVQFLSIVLEHSLRTDFPPQVIAEAERLPADPDPKDFMGREDLRALPFVTIDGETARDFDDAVQLEALPRGGCRLRVAIADVSHYVGERSPLDLEAAQRGTSVYFPDRAIPMLPHQLSNGLCSLNPDRDRLVQVADITYDRHGNRKESRFYRGVIRSRARLTYTKVAAMLSSTDTPETRALRHELEALLDQLRRMHELMKVLLRKRIAAGSLDLDLPEAMVDLSEEGRSISVRFLQRNDAHRLIEEFMLEANQAVALYLKEHDVPFPYRVHEPPDPDSIDELNEFLRAFGFSIDYDGEVEPRDVQQMLDRLQSHPLARVFTRLVLRSLKQARYTTDNCGHFGLAFSDYCHFTSPIRRYPDLLVHRQLGRLFDGNKDRALSAAEAMDSASGESSRCERNAMEAERAMLDLKKAEFMLDHLLEPEAGTVVSVVKFGLFVELDAYPVEGLIHIDQLPGERFLFEETTHTLVSPRSRQRFRLGDRLVVEATNVSLRQRQIDFALLKRIPAQAALPDLRPESRRRGRGRVRK
jgi:ribonuclease R